MNRWGWVILIALLGGLVLVVTSALEWEEFEAELGPKPVARENPLLALERTWTELGLPSRSVKRLEELPPLDHVLVVHGSGRALGSERVAELMEWAWEGGHLIVMLPVDGAYRRLLVDEARAEEVRDPLLGTVGVRVAIGWDDEGREVEEAWVGDGPGWNVEVKRELRLADPEEAADFWIPEDEDLFWLLQFELGAGQLTLVSEAEWATNEGLGDHEHAAFAWQVVVDEGRRSGAWILYELGYPGLFEWLWARGQLLLVCGLLLLAAWIWRRATRFGPVLPPLPTERRDFVEHLDAAAQFLWKHGRSRQLLEAPRRDLRQHMHVARPDWTRLEPLDLQSAVAECSGLTVDQVDEALHAEDVTQPQQFTPHPAEPADPEGVPMNESEPEGIEPPQSSEGSRESVESTEPAHAEVTPAPAPAPANEPALEPHVVAAIERVRGIREQMSRVVIGQEEVVEEVVLALLAGGHVLIEGVPGLGKTLLVLALARTFGGRFARVQFTPDLMPSDVTGHVVFDGESGSFRLRRGPAFTNLLLADEINRAPAKTQAALLEVMQEGQITIEGEASKLEPPFMALATQNPIEQEGTYPLPEAQLDRFLLKVQIGYPSHEEETALVRHVTEGHVGDGLDVDEIEQVATAEQVVELQRIVAGITVVERVTDYAVRIVRETRSWRGVSMGAGPRGAIALVRVARAKALLEGRSYVIPDDVKSVATAALRHRITLSPELELEGLSTDQILASILAHVDVPRE